MSENTQNLAVATQLVSVPFSFLVIAPPTERDAVEDWVVLMGVELWRAEEYDQEWNCYLVLNAALCYPGAEHGDHRVTEGFFSHHPPAIVAPSVTCLSLQCAGLCSNPAPSDTKTLTLRCRVDWSCSLELGSHICRPTCWC